MKATMDDMGPIRIHIQIKHKSRSVRVHVRQETK